MSRDLDQSVEHIESRAQLLEYFRSGEKLHEQRAFGTEHEKFVFKRDSGQPLSFEEEGGYQDIFTQLAEQYGWEASYDKGHIVALTRDGAALTLEPGGQFELSGALTKTVFETEREFDSHLREIKALAGDRLAFVAWGMNPFDTLEEIPWMPKSRYGIMRRYLPTRGDRGLWMMKKTCTVQGNYDYTSEEDATDILSTSLRISPIVSALMCNSPLTDGAPNGMQSYRCHIWTRTDPDRTGFPDFMYGQDWGYAQYLEYVLDVPMFFIRRDGGYVDVSGTSFRTFMRDGIGDWRATMGDFELHLSTIFPEVRMKTYIEVRGADAGTRESMLALPALWKGILYSDSARRGARSLMVSSSPEQHRACFEQVYQKGIRAETPCGSFRELAQELVDLAGKGLDEIAQREGHASERAFLKPLQAIIDTGKTQADLLLESFERHGGDRMKVVNEWEF